MIDRTLPLALDGYLYLSRLRERAGRDTVPLRAMGRRAVCLVGPDAARFFYDADCFDREGVVPPNVQRTLFGDAAVHLLDGTAHHRRKSLFVSVLDRAGADGLHREVVAEWDSRVKEWQGRRVVLFDETARLLCTAVHRWAGVPLPAEEESATTEDLVAMVDGFASAGPRFVRGLRARRRQERRLERLVDDVRSGRHLAAPDSPLAVATSWRDLDGELLDPHTVAVELLNLLRPTTAVAWLLMYAGHALHHWPAARAMLLEGGPDEARAFAHEVRRFYPFAPFLGARARRDLSHDGVPIREGDLALLDVFGHLHHPAVYPDPWSFDPGRHLGQEPGPFELPAQGGGDIPTGHRCPGEPVTVDVLAALSGRLAAALHGVPDQDLRVTRHRVPATVRSGMVVEVA